MSAAIESRVRTTCPRDCYDACGIVAELSAGRIKRVLGDPEHHRARGALCGKCALAYNGAWIDPNLRLQRPLRRVGVKGSATFSPISWDRALEEIAARLSAILASSGGASVLHTHYTGTCALIAGTFPGRFFNRIGATEVEPDSVCNRAGHEALKLLLGTSSLGFDPRTAEHARCLIVWGANPSASAPHVHSHWLPEARRHAKLIVVDPIRHATADLADLHLQPRPGTDALLAFAILHVLRAQNRLDSSFLSRSVLGWDAVQPHIDAAPPQLASRLTGVPARHIEQAALWYGSGPAMLWLGQGLQRQARGANVIRSCSLLPIATGNLGRLGGGLLYLNGAAERGIDLDALSGSALAAAAPASVSHMDLAASLDDAAACRALFTWNNNIAASSPSQSRLRRALEREDLLHVALDLFHTDTTAFADYVLPAASFLEFDDLVLSYFDYTISAQAAVTAPLGESLPNQEIFRRLARAMRFGEPALFESDQQIIDSMLRQLDYRSDFDTLKRLGTVHWRGAVVVPFADHRFPTPSGKVEVASARWLEAGLSFEPIPHADSLPAPGHLRLLSPADPWLMNSSYANDAVIAKRIGAQTVWLNPQDAQRMNLIEGQRVELRNETGSLAVRLGLTDRVPTSVALLPKGRWPSKDDERGNVNRLNPGTKTDLGASCAVHSIEVEIGPYG